ncbi:MAG: alpha amylase C-terminal domain-containing protein, partial [Clostridia bacterium]|nr:alpha amylase C-terminal domain-containing protein [Clostridia bacterium]
SRESYVIPVSKGEDHEVIFTSDDPAYDGFGRIAHQTVSAYVPGCEGNNLRLYIPARTCIVLRPKSLK